MAAAIERLDRLEQAALSVSDVPELSSYTLNFEPFDGLRAGWNSERPQLFNGLNGLNRRQFLGKRSDLNDRNISSSLGAQARPLMNYGS